MAQAIKVTLCLQQFGQLLITRSDAATVLQALEDKWDIPVLDFTGVDVANHPFADELGKGLMAHYSMPDLSAVQVIGTTPYVQNGVEAGFSTAAA
jgi:hypothetical protein